MIKLKDWLDEEEINYTLDSEGYIILSGSFSFDLPMDCSLLREVKGRMFLRYSEITSFPNLEKVGSWIDVLSNKFCFDFPKLRIVKDKIYLKNSKLLNNKRFITKMILLGKTFDKESKVLE